MKCIICKQDITGGNVVLVKGKAFMLLGSINVDDFTEYEHSMSDMKELGWEEEVMCEDCKLLVI